MPELFDTSGVPDDEAHWDALATRVASRVATGALADRRAGRFSSSPAVWLGVSALFAAGLVAMILSGRPASSNSSNSSNSSDGGELRVVLAPADDVGRALAVRDAPPAIGALLLEPLTEKVR
jgi:hypothetical protein